VCVCVCVCTHTHTHTYKLCASTYYMFVNIYSQAPSHTPHFATFMQ